MRVTIFGGTGLLGKALTRIWQGDELTSLGSIDADIRSPQTIKRVIEQHRPDWIVLAAAYTDVDGCETNQQLAFDVNTQGAIDVALDVVAVDARRALSHGTVTAGRYVRLTVCDSGHGMDAATLERIFEPFFTTKAFGTGTGLGLAMVHGIVADHGGAIDVHSRPGAGSRFEVYFRQTEAPADGDRSEAPLARGRGETILIVDDEKPLVLLGEEMAAALGYEPVGFESSTRALAAFRAEPQRFDLVLADEVMPEMTGTQLATALQAIRPDLPIILMTGYSGPGERSRPRPGIREILKKPLLLADIAGAVARHLHPGEQSAAVSSDRPGHPPSLK